MLKFSTLRPISTPSIKDGFRLQDLHPRISLIFYNFGWVVTDGIGESRSLLDYAISGRSFRLSSMDVNLFVDDQQMRRFFDHSFGQRSERVFQSMVRAVRDVPRQLSALTLDEFFGMVGDQNLNRYRRSPHLLMSKLGHCVVERNKVLPFSRRNLRPSALSLQETAPESWFWEQQSFASLLRSRTEKFMMTEGSEMDLGSVSHRAVTLTEPAIRFIDNENQFLFLPHPWLSEHPQVLLCETNDEEAVFEGAYWTADRSSNLSGWLAHVPDDYLSIPTRAYWKKHLRIVNADRSLVGRTLPMDLTVAARG